MKKIMSVNLDANESVFFARQLEYIKTKTYDVRYPQYKATALMPVDTSAGPGANAVTYRQFDSVGLMKIAASYADDAPRSDVKGQEFTTPVKSLIGAYGYSVQDIRNAMFAQVSLKDQKAKSSRRSYEQTINNIAWFADGSANYGGLTGFLYNANTSKDAAPTGTWSSATADQIIADVNFAINDVAESTLQTEAVNTVLLPVAQHALIATVPRSATSDTTILEFLRRVHPGVSFEAVNELAGLDPKPSGDDGPTDVMIAYTRDNEHLELQIPQPYEQFNAQERGLEFVVPTHGRIGNVIFYYPESCHIVEDI